MKKILLLSLLSLNANAQVVSDIEQHFFCSMFAYQTLKTQLISGKQNFSEEIQQLDMIGTLRGKAQQLVLSRFGPGMSIYADWRNKSLLLWNEEMKHVQSLSIEDQAKWGQDTGLECGKLYSATFYTQEEVERANRGRVERNAGITA